MINCFETGKWYRWVGPKVRQKGWNPLGKMDFLLDGKPHKCCFGDGMFADFKGNERGPSPFDGWVFNAEDLKNFEEVNVFEAGGIVTNKESPCKITVTLRDVQDLPVRFVWCEEPKKGRRAIRKSLLRRS